MFLKNLWQLSMYLDIFYIYVSVVRQVRSDMVITGD